jgi:ABC-type antimicrobial peptide transport system permease subunit
VGSLLAGALFILRGADAGRAAGLLLIVAALISVVGLLAAVGPARRGLRIQPTEALRES